MKLHQAHKPAVVPPAQGGIMGFFRTWDRFWFAPSDPITLGMMRLCAGLIVVYVHLMYSFDLPSYVGREGWMDNGNGSIMNYLRKESKWYAVPWTWNYGYELPKADQDKLLVGTGTPYWSIYYHLDDPFWMYATHFTIVGVMVLFMLGLWTRVTSVLTWIGAMFYLQRAPALLFGMDTMMNILLIYLMIAPGGAALSLDSWLRRRREQAEGLPDRGSPPLVSATFATRLIQIHFCLIYLAAGLSKLQGPAWWNGNATWGTVANSYFAPLNVGWFLSGLEFISQHRWLWELTMSLGCLFTLALEIGFPFLVWHCHLRTIMVISAVLLHTGIGLSMGLVTFGLCMMTMLLAFVPPEAVHDLIARWMNRPTVARDVKSTLPPRIASGATFGMKALASGK